MKKTLIVVAAALLLSLAGCHCSRIQVIETSSPANQHCVPSGSFNDEEYVWESWWFGTNRVYKLDELDK